MSTYSRAQANLYCYSLGWDPHHNQVTHLLMGFLHLFLQHLDKCDTWCIPYVGKEPSFSHGNRHGRAKLWLCAQQNGHEGQKVLCISGCTSVTSTVSSYETLSCRHAAYNFLNICMHVPFLYLKLWTLTMYLYCKCHSVPTALSPPRSAST